VSGRAGAQALAQQQTVIRESKPFRGTPMHRETIGAREKKELKTERRNLVKATKKKNEEFAQVRMTSRHAQFSGCTGPGLL